MNKISDKVLVMLVGPSAIGKSSIMNACVRQDERFAYVRSFTTRARRPDETVSHYEFISEATARQWHRDGKTVTYVEHPSTHALYGTTVESYPGRYNLLDTLSDSVDTYRDLPFETTYTISLTAPVEQWQRWFLWRYPSPSGEANKRLEEAALSIEWSLGQTHDHLWLVNSQDQLDQAATHLIELVNGGAAADDGRPHAEAILALIKKNGVWS